MKRSQFAVIVNIILIQYTW